MRTFLLVLLGALAGGALGAATYVLLQPVLEESSGLLRETQGLLWNLVPLLTVLGGLAGWWWARRPTRLR